MAVVPTSTDRIRFRPYRDGDVALVTELFADEHARRFYPEMIDERQCQMWIDTNRERYEADGFGLWAIEDRQSGSFLGDCGFTFQDVEGHRRLELGYHLTATARGRGLITEAGRACLDHAFDDLRQSWVCSIVDPENTPSIAVAARLHEWSKVFENQHGRLRMLFWTER